MQLSSAISGCEIIGDVPSLGCLAGVIVNVINIALTFVGTAVLAYFLYGCVLIIISRGDPKGQEKGKKTITYAIFGLIAVFSIFILSNIISTALGVPNPLSGFTVFTP